MDRIDIRILNCLKKNSRENASVIGEKVNMSVSAVIERIRKLENAGIIKQYTVVLDPKQIGKDLSALISVGIEHPRYNDGFTEFVQSHPEIVECHYVTGDFDFILKVLTNTTGSLERILNEIKSVPGVSVTKTLVILSTVKNDFSAGLEADAKP